jgi:hypothetical protein
VEEVAPLAALAAGIAFGLSFNPLTSVIATSIAAFDSGTTRASAAALWRSAAVLVVGWLVGDGFRAMAWARDALASDGGATAQVLVLAAVTWAVVGLAVGYVLPAATGVFVGRRVTFGTGRLAAASVAVGTALALSVVLVPVADRLGAFVS